MPPASSAAAVYDESKIKTLSSLEHIRARTGMYIGRIGDGSHYDDGIYVLLKEVIDNAVDEFIMGHGHEVLLTIDGLSVVVRDFGRGIPLGKIVECVSRINTGAKYNDDVFQFSVGLNGVGTKAVNALSSMFTVASFRDGQFARASFKQGVIEQNRKPGVDRAGERNGTLVEFSPDPTIFKKSEFKEEHVTRRLRMYTYLNAGLKIRYNGTLYHSKNGLLDLLDEDTDNQQDALYAPLHHREKTLELAITHTQRFNETHYSFVNGQFTSDGGTHLSAFREGVLKAVNDFTKKKYDGDDVREGLVGAIAIRLKEPIFESQTKNKLGNTEIRGELVKKVQDVISDLLHRNPEAAEKIAAKVEDTARLRRELASVKKLARERSAATTLRIPQLKDCKLHLNQKKGNGGGSMIFLTEGQSAAGSLVSCRDVMTQAIFVLKGKPLNVNDLKRAALYKNDELYNLMRALNVEESVDGLRYEQVILATDADVDGLHIRNLLITFFLRFFPELVTRGHVYILETPLFRVRNKKKTVYCYDEAERVAAINSIAGPEITRFKGLGEINPTEFKAFVGREMRLSPVEVENLPATPHILDFYMGKNTPERRTYIMDKLVVEADEALLVEAV